MKIAFVLSPDFTALDLIGPYEVISLLIEWLSAAAPVSGQDMRARLRRVRRVAARRGSPRSPRTLNGRWPASSELVARGRDVDEPATSASRARAPHPAPLTLVAISSETPIVIFGHAPLLAVYPQWGWATADSARVLQQLSRFGSVTALNGHIHQIISKTEGNVLMHTGASTAYPLHRPGNVAPEPLTVTAGGLPSRIGIRTVQFHRGSSSLALIDESLAGPPQRPARR
jgi:hypothetical protein